MVTAQMQGNAVLGTRHGAHSTRRGSTLLVTRRVSMTPRLSLANANSVNTVEFLKAASNVTGRPLAPYVVVELAVTLPAQG